MAIEELALFVATVVLLTIFGIAGKIFIRANNPNQGRSSTSQFAISLTAANAAGEFHEGFEIRLQLNQ
ncbi:MAG: hypothetical protein V3T49_04370 [Dehalococcoidia bacterium]